MPVLIHCAAMYLRSVTPKSARLHHPTLALMALTIKPWLAGFGKLVWVPSPPHAWLAWRAKGTRVELKDPVGEGLF